MQIIPIKRALISVSDKTNLVSFVEKLHAMGVEILSTGGTAKLLTKEGIPVINVSDYTNFPEMMDGRVKTLHPKIHGGLLGRLNIDEAVMAEHSIEKIDLLVVNLYPFKETIDKDECKYSDAIENIDIGGPAMLRAGAKNHERVSVITDPVDYQDIIDEMTAQNASISFITRQRLAAKVYAHTASYDAQIANYLNEQSKLANNTLANADNEIQPIQNNLLILGFKENLKLRYGENPHQQASVYTNLNFYERGIANSVLLQGKPLSYNNLSDADAAVACVYEYTDLACVIVKHANPCGVSVGTTSLEAYNRAYACDPTSAFGGIIAFNHHVDEATITEIIKRQFVEVIVAPSIASSALKILSSKSNIRVLALGENFVYPKNRQILTRISGGLLMQNSDDAQIAEADLKIVTSREPKTNELHDLLFAWKTVKHVKSNAIVFAKDKMTVGIGCGQTSRIHSTMIAAIKAKEQNLDLVGAVMASDAFFPFRDGIDNAAKYGISAVIQPGGSMRDDEVIAAANEHNIAMIMTGIRHFKH